VGGVLKSSKALICRYGRSQFQSITDRDWECTTGQSRNDSDYLALSFVAGRGTCSCFREHLATKSADIHLIAKIEKAEAIRRSTQSWITGDGSDWSRGDLGRGRLDVAQVADHPEGPGPAVQVGGKPSDRATQMLQSMIEQPSPDPRAEVSDVANAIFDGPTR